MCRAPSQAAPGRNKVADLPGRASGHRKSSPLLCVDGHPGGCQHRAPWPPGWGTKVDGQHKHPSSRWSPNLSMKLCLGLPTT